MHRVTPIDPVEHVGELRRRDRDAAALHGGPNEAAALQPLGIEREPQSVVPEDLDQVAALAPKHEEVAGERIASKRLLYLQRQPVHAAPHIGAPDRKPYAHT